MAKGVEWRTRAWSRVLLAVGVSGIVVGALVLGWGIGGFKIPGMGLSYSVPADELNDQGTQTIWKLAWYHYLDEEHYYHTAPAGSLLSIGAAGEPYPEGQAIAGSNYATTFFLYRVLEIPFEGPYSIHLSFYLKQSDTGSASNIHHWVVHVIGDLSVFPEIYYHYVEWDTDNHGQWLSEELTITGTMIDHYMDTGTPDGSPLNDQEIYLLIGFRDAWSAEYNQQIEFYFTEITIQQLS